MEVYTVTSRPVCSVTPYPLVDYYQLFGEIAASVCTVDTLRMVATCSFETFVGIYQTTRRNIPENSNSQNILSIPLYVKMLGILGSVKDLY
jgi:hypothetical protein